MKWPKNDPKWPKFTQKWPKMYGLTFLVCFGHWAFRGSQAMTSRSCKRKVVFGSDGWSFPNATIPVWDLAARRRQGIRASTIAQCAIVQLYNIHCSHISQCAMWLIYKIWIVPRHHLCHRMDQILEPSPIWHICDAHKYNTAVEW